MRASAWPFADEESLEGPLKTRERLSFRSTRQRFELLGMRIDATSYSEAVSQVLAWASAGESRYVCCASVNNIIHAWDSADFRLIMNQADLVTPDGMPLVWSLRWQGASQASRVYGPDLARFVLRAAEKESLPVGFYGSSPETLALLAAQTMRMFPALHIAYAFAPPFRPLSSEEDSQIAKEIRRSGVRILFVGLSTPKQECWMYAHRGHIPAVMLGVGAAFDFLAGTKRQAPRWMQCCGLEWLFRLCSEPRRLGPRYLRQNPRFLLLCALQLLRARNSG